MHRCTDHLPESAKPGERTTCSACNVTYEWDARLAVWKWVPNG